MFLVSLFCSEHCSLVSFSKTFKLEEYAFPLVKSLLDLIGFTEATVYSNTAQKRSFLITRGGERVRSGDTMIDQAVTVCPQVNNLGKNTNLHINTPHTMYTWSNTQ